MFDMVDEKGLASEEMGVYHLVATRLVVPEGSPVAIARACDLRSAVRLAGLLLPYSLMAYARRPATYGLHPTELVNRLTVQFTALT